MSNKELTMNDAYLIADKEGNLKILAYRKNLIEEFGYICEKAIPKIEGLDLYNIKQFREFVSIADEEAYCIYQLTRL